MSSHKNLTGGMGSEVDKGGAIECARIEVMSGEGDQILRMDTRYLEPQEGPLTSHLNMTFGWIE